MERERPDGCRVRALQLSPLVGTAGLRLDAASRFSGMTHPLASGRHRIYGTRLPENGNLEVGKREKIF
jgi:hypothetical protein